MATPKKTSAKEVIKELERKARDQEDFGDLMPTVITAGIEDLHNSVLPMFVLALLYIITIVVQIIALPLITIAPGDWYSSFSGYRILLPPLFGVPIAGFIIYAYSHNLKRWTYNIHLAVVGFWTLILTIYAIWLLLELLWYCPQFMPTYCTNGVTSSLGFGYLLHAIATLIQVPILWIELWVFRRALRYWRVLYRSTSFTATDLSALIHNNPAYAQRYLVSIGSKMGKAV